MAVSASIIKARNLFFITGLFCVKTDFASNYFTNIQFIFIYTIKNVLLIRGWLLENETITCGIANSCPYLLAF